MDAADTAQLAEIEVLLEERRKIEQWITTLESRREATPAHVYARVHADYTAKCEAAQSALQDKMDAVRSVAHSLELTLAGQDEAIAHRQDERAEVELRALVGEYTEDEWNRRRALLDDALRSMQHARAEVSRELDKMFGLLTQAQPGFVAATLPVVEAPPEVVPAPSEARVEPVVERVVEPVVEPVVEQVVEPVAEPLVEPSVPDEPPLGLFTPVAEPTVSAEPAKAHLTEEQEKIAFLRSVLGRSTPAAPAPAPAPAPQPAPVPNKQPLSAPTPNTAQAARTLVCQECKAMNFPTEWYCEKCGGELAAY